MGIRFHCHACEKKLNVKAFLGGKRGICPHCGAKIAIPPAEGSPPVSEAARAGNSIAPAAQSAPTPQAQAIGSLERPSPQIAANVSTDSAQPAVVSPAPEPQAAPVDPLSETTGSVWYVRPPSGGQYGPASAEYMRRWIEEGRISSDSLVWREGWPDWQSASTALAGLIGGGATSPAQAAPVPESPVAGLGANLSTVDTSSTKRSSGRRKKRSNTMALVWAVVLGLMVVGLLIALIVVLSK